MSIRNRKAGFCTLGPYKQDADDSGTFYRVGYLGPNGSFSEAAASVVLANMEERADGCECTDGNEAVVAGLKNGDYDMIVMTVYNSNTGDMPDHIKMLKEAGAVDTGVRIDVPVIHCLMGKKPVFDTQETVICHPKALAQCAEWFSNQSKMAARFTTSNSQAAIDAAKDDQDPDEVCCIAPEVCAEANGLTIYEVGIQEDPNNFTRFGVFVRG